jgi:hypothetical protein
MILNYIDNKNIKSNFPNLLFYPKTKLNMELHILHLLSENISKKAFLQDPNTKHDAITSIATENSFASFIDYVKYYNANVCDRLCSGFLSLYSKSS